MTIPDFLTSSSSSLFSFLTNNPIYQNQTARVALFTFGALMASVKAFGFTKAILTNLIRLDRDFGARYGHKTWVVITGASDGIGETFAYEFARRGFNIVLVGRNPTKLDKVAQEISNKYPSVQTRTVVKDFSHSYEEGFAESIHDQVKDLDVSILINNAGVSGAGYYHNMPTQKISELVLTNTLAHALITRVFLPDLAARANRSAIINVSSLASSFPRPFVSVYAATKVFHDYLSRGIAYEHSNIDILSMKPGGVSTKMTGHRDVKYPVISREEFVECTLKSLGRTSHTYGHWNHRLDGFMVDSCPDFLIPSVFRKRYQIK